MILDICCGFPWIHLTLYPWLYLLIYTCLDNKHYTGIVCSMCSFCWYCLFIIYDWCCTNNLCWPFCHGAINTCLPGMHYVFSRHLLTYCDHFTDDILLLYFQSLPKEYTHDSIWHQCIDWVRVYDARPRLMKFQTMAYTLCKLW